MPACDKAQMTFLCGVGCPVWLLLQLSSMLDAVPCVSDTQPLASVPFLLALMLWQKKGLSCGYRF